MLRLILKISAVFFCAVQAAAQVPLEGWLIAQRDCEAYQSKNTLSNPGNVSLEVGFAYPMLGLNAQDGDWYQIRVAEAPAPTARWVHKSCGIHVISGGETAEADGEINVSVEDFLAPEDQNEATDLVIAISWQPAFCETRPTKRECEDLNAGLLPHTEQVFSLHGLWPNEVAYCGVPQNIIDLDTPSQWSSLPAPQLDADTKTRLAYAMPGVASGLENHEWIKHGTCYYGEGQGDEYYDDSLLVLDAFNQTGLAQLFVEHLGQELSRDEIQGFFESTFGPAAGSKVTVRCSGDGNRTIITELQISLGGEITENFDLTQAIFQGRQQRPGCESGFVDRVGLQ